MRYRGESYQKKIARAAFWQKVDYSMFGFQDARFLVLASENGGDISTLLSLGIDREQIVAVDIDRGAADKCRERWGDPVHHMDIVEAATSLGRFDVVHADFCGVTSAKVMDTLAGIFRSFHPSRFLEEEFYRPVVGVVVKRGREKDEGSIRPSLPRRVRRAIRAHGRMEVTPNSALEVCKELGIPDGAAREFVLASTFVSQGIFLYPHQIIDYQSKDKKSNGSPMTSIIWSVGPGSERADKWDHDRGVFMRADKASFLRLTPMTEKWFRGHVLSYIRRGGKDPARAFSIPKPTITAWKAHETRGTYK